MIATAVYLACMLTSLLCAGLLARAYLRSRLQLLLWTALSFGALALNNFLLVLDMLVFPGVDLSVFRWAATFSAICLMIYGFIREVR